MISPAQAVIDAAAALIAAIGSTPAEAVQNLLLGQTFGESFWGRAVAGYATTMAGSNNVGSVIGGVGSGPSRAIAPTTSPWMTKHKSDPGYGLFAHPDTNKGVVFVQWFRLFPSQLDGWKGYIEAISYGNLAATLDAAAAGARAFSELLGKHGYYDNNITDKNPDPVGRYAGMVSSNAARVAGLRKTAVTMGLTAATPSQAGRGETQIAPLADRFRRSPQLIPLIKPESGVVYFTEGPALPVDDTIDFMAVEVPRGQSRSVARDISAAGGLVVAQTFSENGSYRPWSREVV